MKPRKYRAKAMPELTLVTADKNNDWVQKFNEPKWVYGYYAPTYLAEIDGEIKNTYCIISDDTIGKQEMLGCGHYTGLPKAYHIIEDTLSQSTGLFDKNGKEIFEGDIFEIDDKCSIIVQWSGAGYFELLFVEFGEDDCDEYCEPIWSYDLEKMEIVGNIYDNKELIGE